MEIIKNETGLSPIQERAINLLLSGATITSVAEKLNIDRSTIYQWQSKENFQAYYNELSQKIKFNTESELIGMYREALDALRESLNVTNDSVRLKAACWLIEKIHAIEPGETDVRKMILEKCTEEAYNFELKRINNDKLERLLKENNLQEND